MPYSWLGFIKKNCCIVLSLLHNVKAYNQLCVNKHRWTLKQKLTIILYINSRWVMERLPNLPLHTPAINTTPFRHDPRLELWPSEPGAAFWSKGRTWPGCKQPGPTLLHRSLFLNFVLFFAQVNSFSWGQTRQDGQMSWGSVSRFGRSWCSNPGRDKPIT